MPSARAAPAGFVGRDAEIGTLTAALDAMLAGRGTLAILRGDHGAGKTRLAAEVAQRADARDIAVLAGACIDSGSRPLFWPWAQIVRRYAAQHDAAGLRAAFGSAAADVARIAPALRDRCPDLDSGPPVDPGLALVRVHDGLLTFVARAAAAEPLLIVIDDLQWADAESLRVLEALAAELPHLRAVVLTLVESAGPESEVEARLPAAAAERPGCVCLELAGLPVEAVRALMAHTLQRPVPAATARLIGQLAGGNALVVLDTLRHLDAAELLPPATATWPTRAAIARAGVAEATCAMVTRRLGLLDAPCRRVLGIAAVAGDEFAFAAVDRAAGVDGDAALPAIETAVRVGLVRPIDDVGARYRFVAPYVCAAIRQSLNPTRRTIIQAQLSAAGT
jgi:predicted ATPase